MLKSMAEKESCSVYRLSCIEYKKGILVLLLRMMRESMLSAFDLISLAFIVSAPVDRRPLGSRMR